MFQIRFISEKAIFIIMMMFLSPKVLLLVLQATLDRPKLDIKMVKTMPDKLTDKNFFAFFSCIGWIISVQYLSIPTFYNLGSIIWRL